MTLSELKIVIDELIKRGNGDLEVLSSSDSEGNSFNSVYELSISHCYEDEPVHPDDIGTEYDEEDLVEKVVIWV